MENLWLIKTEIILGIISFCYIVYYSFEKFYLTKLKPKVDSIINNDFFRREEPKEKISILKAENFYKKLHPKTKNSKEDKEKLEDIIKRVKINSSKGYLETSKYLIIEGLTLDKTNRELNLELANIYEKEKKYKHAEYIYSDLIESKDDNFEIFKKLGYVLAIQKKYEKSIKIYQKALAKKSSDFETIEMLTDLNFEIGNYKASLKYVLLYLKEKPKDINKLTIKGISYENMGKIIDAMNTYKFILELQPYNTEIIERLDNLES